MAYQVAERLPGFADLLLLVAVERGAGESLTLDEVFKQ